MLTCVCARTREGAFQGPEETPSRGTWPNRGGCQPWARRLLWPGSCKTLTWATREATSVAPFPWQLGRALARRCFLPGRNCLHGGWMSSSTRPNTASHLISWASAYGLKPEPTLPPQAAGQRLTRRVCLTGMGRDGNRRVQKRALEFRHMYLNTQEE